MKRAAQWVGLLATVSLIGYLAWPGAEDRTLDWEQSGAAPLRPMGTNPRITIFSNGMSGHLSLDLTGRDPEFREGEVMRGGIGLGRGGRHFAVAGDRNMEMAAAAEVVDALSLDVVGPVELRILGADSAVILSVLMTSNSSASRITLEW